MRSDMYHDADGNRIMLDTRILRQVGSDPDFLERVRQKEAREKKAKREINFLKTVLCIPAAIFTLHYVPILYLRPVEVLESVGVLACLALMVSTITGFWEEG